MTSGCRWKVGSPRPSCLLPPSTPLRATRRRWGRGPGPVRWNSCSRAGPAWNAGTGCAPGLLWKLAVRDGGGHSSQTLPAAAARQPDPCPSSGAPRASRLRAQCGLSLAAGSRPVRVAGGREGMGWRTQRGWGIGAIGTCAPREDSGTDRERPPSTRPCSLGAAPLLGPHPAVGLSVHSRLPVPEPPSGLCCPVPSLGPDLPAAVASGPLSFEGSPVPQGKPPPRPPPRALWILLSLPWGSGDPRDQVQLRPPTTCPWHCLGLSLILPGLVRSREVGA